MPEGTTVPCAKSRDVTLSLEELDPIPGIIHEFEQLNFADIDPHGNKHNLNDTDFEWNFLETIKEIIMSKLVLDSTGMTFMVFLVQIQSQRSYNYPLQLGSYYSRLL